MSFKMAIPVILMRFGFRLVLVANTILIGLAIMLFATVGHGTPVWQIILLAAVFGFCSSLQYTSMNTLIYADIGPADASMASTIGSTTQQMSISFSVAGASLVTALFIPDRFHNDPHEMIHGLHQTFFVLGGLTLLSTIVFWELHADDGENVSQHAGKMPEH
jgi:MFS family permease